MEDDLDQPVEGDESAAPPPSAAPATPDLESIVSKVLAEQLPKVLDSRISGLQSVMDKRMAALAKDLKNAGLSQEQQQEALQEEQNEQVTKALRLAELVKRRKENPEAVDFFIEMMDAQDWDDQVAIYQTHLGTKAIPTTGSPSEPATPPSGGAPNDTPVPDVDKNNPASSRSPAQESGEEMTDELADSILSKVGRGDFRKFLRGG